MPLKSGLNFLYFCYWLLVDSESPSNNNESNDAVDVVGNPEETEAGVRNDPLDPVADTIDKVKESLVRTLRICLSRKEIMKIKREYVRNMKKMRINNEEPNAHDLDFAKVLEEVTKSIEEEY